MNRIEQLRKEQRLSQQGLAEKMGVHQTAVSQWESGRTTPTFETVNDLCSLFDVELGYLLGYSENRGHFHLTDEEQEELGRLTVEEERHEINAAARISAALERLNNDGHRVAAERVEELTKIPDYQRQEISVEAPEQ